MLRALQHFRQETATSESVLQPYDAELGYAYHHLALALLATGDLKGSVEYYQRSIKTLELARDHMASGKVGDGLQTEYASSLKSELSEYARILSKAGDSDGAAAAERRANSLP